MPTESGSPPSSAGYACSKFVSWLPGARRPLAALCCTAAFVYPVVASWQSAWQRYHSWPNSSQFIDDFELTVAHSQGLLYVPPSEVNIAEYYTPQDSEWDRWNETLSLNPPITTKRLNNYYSGELNSGDYGVITLFYSTTFSSGGLPENILLPSHLPSSGSSIYQQDLLNAVGKNSDEPGLAALTLAIESNEQYSLFKEGDYNTTNISGTHDYGYYAIWKKKEPT